MSVQRVHTRTRKQHCKWACVCCIYRFFFCARRSRDPLLEQNVLCLFCTTHQHFSILSPALRQPRSLFDRLPMCAASVVRRAVCRAPPPVRTLHVRRATKRSADPLRSRTMKPAIAVNIGRLGWKSTAALCTRVSRQHGRVESAHARACDRCVAAAAETHTARPNTRGSSEPCAKRCSVQ